MCLQCETNAVHYGYPLPGFALMKAMKTDYPNWPEGQKWKEGMYGLVECNDPTVYLTQTPMKDPGEDSSREEDRFFEVADATEKDVMQTQYSHKVYKLIAAATTKGYNPETDGRFGPWLTNYLAVYLETAIPMEDPVENAVET